MNEKDIEWLDAEYERRKISREIALLAKHYYVERTVGITDGNFKEFDVIVIDRIMPKNHAVKPKIEKGIKWDMYIGELQERRVFNDYSEHVKRIEVKADRRFKGTLNACLEVRNSSGNRAPSGISTSMADELEIAVIDEKYPERAPVLRMIYGMKALKSWLRNHPDDVAWIYAKGDSYYGKDSILMHMDDTKRFVSAEYDRDYNLIEDKYPRKKRAPGRRKNNT